MLEQATTTAQRVLDFRLFEVGGTSVTFATLLTGIAIVAVGFVVSQIGQRGMEKALARRGLEVSGTLGSVQRLVHYAIVLMAIGIALDTIGIDLAALFAAGAIFAVGIGFAMQNIAQNFVSGVILLVERAIKPGDIVEVNSTVVKVVEMGIRSTLVRTRDDEDLIVPNSMLVQSTVKNFTLRDKSYRIRAPVGVVYSADMAQVTSVLTEMAEKLPWRTQGMKPRVLMVGFGSSSVDFEVSVWIDNPWDAPASRSALHEAIWWALKDNGITIAFPQLDVHFDPGVTEGLGRKAG